MGQMQSKVSPFSHLCHNVIHEIALYLSTTEFLPGIYSGRLYIVNIRSRKYRSVLLPEFDFCPAQLVPLALGLLYV